MKKVDVEVLKPFSTTDWGEVVTAKKGDIIKITEALAVRLAKSGHVRKVRKGKKQYG